MGDPFEGKAFPKAPLLGAAALVGATILLAATARLGDVGTTHVAPAPRVAAYALNFTDRADGAVLVDLAADAARPAPRRIGELAPNTNGFARGVLRSLAHERRRQGLGPERPFMLTRYADGRLTLSDPATGRRIDLEVFGPTNAGAFASLWLAADAAAAPAVATNR
jgi:putative photosynthetic complex assembly protein